MAFSYLVDTSTSDKVPSTVLMWIKALKNDEGTSFKNSRKAVDKCH